MHNTMFIETLLTFTIYWILVVVAIKNVSDNHMRKPSTVSSTMKNTKNPTKIPLNIIMELNQIADISELFTKFLPNVDMPRTLVASTGFQSRSNIQRGSDVLTKSAGCAVESKTISLKDTDDPSIYFYPACTRVNRCGGCCSHELLSCQPNITEIVRVNVKIIQFVGVREFRPLGTKSLMIDQHLKCMCKCIIKKEDCSQFQSYDPDECHCMCNNEEDHGKCNEEYNLKIWNTATCACECRDTNECTEGSEFNYNTCRCETSNIIQKNTTNEFTRNAYSQILRQRQPYTIQ